jgi:hypothetical protein
MVWLDDRWTTEIQEISNSTDYLNAVVNLIDPSNVTTTWDIDTNEPVVTGNGVVARGIPARINWPLRAVIDPGTATANPSVVRAGRMTIPWSAYSGALRTGMQFIVTNGGDNPDLLRYVFRIDESINGSNAPSRVMKISVDGESAEDVASNGAYQ